MAIAPKFNEKGVNNYLFILPTYLHGTVLYKLQLITIYIGKFKENFQRYGI